MRLTYRQNKNIAIIFVSNIKKRRFLGLECLKQKNLIRFQQVFSKFTEIYFRFVKKFNQISPEFLKTLH